MTNNTQMAPYRFLDEDSTSNLYVDDVCSDEAQAQEGSAFSPGASYYVCETAAARNTQFRDHENNIEAADAAVASPSTLASLEEYLSSMPQDYDQEELIDNPIFSQSIRTPNQADHLPGHANQQLVNELSGRDCYPDSSTLVAANSCSASELQIEMERFISQELRSSDMILRPCELIEKESELMKAAIISHPHYSSLVAAHMNCHKIGAPPEVVSQIDDLVRRFRERSTSATTTSIGVDAELDQFLYTYCRMLQSYEQEITKTFDEAMACCKKLEIQLKILSPGSIASGESEERNEGGTTSDEEDSGGDDVEIDALAEEKEIKEQLMRKYSSYIGSLKREFSRKKKKGKLPRESRQQLLDWWSTHIKWPYPSEVEKARLAESTGLDQKQINNWFINQRKRHWKPSDEAVAFVHPNKSETHGGTDGT